jgi:hypothetical protein
MRDQRAEGVSRRELLGSLTLGAMAGLLGVRPESATAEPPPETTRLRLAHTPGICIAPYYLAKEFLPAEGFTDEQDVKTESTMVPFKAVVAEEVDIALNFSGPLITRVDAGDPLVILAGIHVGCFQLFGGERVRAIHDLKGKRVAVRGLGLPPMSSSPVWRPMWVWILLRTSTGSCTPQPRPCSSSLQARSMPSWAFRQSPKNSGQGRSGPWS